jgi:hypothetical protein
MGLQRLVLLISTGRMLKQRIISTLKFFDLQDYPLTLLELHKFLLADIGGLKKQINTQWELVNEAGINQKVGISDLADCLDKECQNEAAQKNGFYCLPGRAEIVDRRLADYIYGIKRERRIQKFTGGLRHMPFVRGVGLAGSQAMGPQKQNSDIDLLIIVDQRFLWLARTVATAYFQILGLRRHGNKIANRFCLNHYLAGVKTINELKNLYTAWEYAKLRPLVYSNVIEDFQTKNGGWIAEFFSNFEVVGINNHQRQFSPPPPASAGYSSLKKGEKLPPSLKLRRTSRESPDEPSAIQNRLERMLSGKFGQWLEAKLKNRQLPKIRQEEFILVRDDELSFHPQSKQQKLLGQFFIG